MLNEIEKKKNGCEDCNYIQNFFIYILLQMKLIIRDQIELMEGVISEKLLHAW